MLRDYIVVQTIDECLQLLQGKNGKARVVAGGTDLIPQIEKKTQQPAFLIDVSKIPELRTIRQDDGKIYIGAAVTHAEVAASSLIRQSAPLLAEASLAVGSPQVRNIATIAGNVINAQPAADAAIALVALGAKAEIISTGGTTEEYIENLYLGVGLSKIDSTSELLSRIYFSPIDKNQGTAFLRMSPRNALSLPILNIAVVLTIDDSFIQDVRIALGPVAEKPFRPLLAEASLKGSRPDTDTIKKAAKIIHDECSPRDSLLRGSSAYRRKMVQVLSETALLKAVANVYPS